MIAYWKGSALIKYAGGISEIVRQLDLMRADIEQECYHCIQYDEKSW